MKRSLGIERVFTLGNYKTIRFIDSVDDLPDEVMFNNELVNKIRYLQMINIELNYREYVKMHEDINLMSLEDAMEELDKRKSSTLEDIGNILNTKNSNKKEVN